MRAAGAAAVLVMLAMAVIAAGDSRAWSGSDAGGRAATAVAMVERGTWTPAVGYWAERWDPDGRHHPLINTERRGDHWVQATSVPYAVAGRPLYGWLGVPGLLVLPVAGCVAAAFAAGALARWADARSPWPAFWAVGMLTPALFYAADAWEHAPALGFGAGALALAVAGRRWPSATLAGLAAGVAVVLRAEMAVYAAAAGVSALLIGGQRRRWLREWPRAVLLAVAAAAPVAGNALAERRLLGAALRSQRAVALAEGAGASAGRRAGDAVLTTVGIVAESSLWAFALGGLAAAALLLLGWWAVWGRPARALLAGGVIGIGLVIAVAVRVDDGLRFIPGWLPAAPLAAAGVAVLVRRQGRGATDERGRFLALVALTALPGVWVTAHVGRLEAQWGGRYVLLTGVLLTVLGVVALDQAGSRRATALLAAVAVAVAGHGVAWHVHRTNSIAGVASWVNGEAPAGGVVVSRWPDLGREAGAWYGTDRWLTASTAAETAGAVEIAAAAGATEVLVVVPPGAATGATPGWIQREEVTYTVFGATIRALTLRLDR